jgi:propionate CoA-transferase
VGIIRATTADPDGNLTMEREALTLEALAIAMAARNSGGIVIAQVERIAERGSLQPAPGQGARRAGRLRGGGRSSPSTTCRPSPSPTTRPSPGEIRCRWTACCPMPWRAQDHRAPRRAGAAPQVVNLGIGMPEGVASVAAEERIIDLITLTAEPGVIGGIPAGGLNFGAAVNTAGHHRPAHQFDFYDGGGLDIAVLGLAQADRRATSTSASSARAWPAPAASSTSARTPRTWCSSAPSPPALEVAGGASCASGRRQVLREVEHRTFSGSEAKAGARKFVREVEHRTFSGPQACNARPARALRDRALRVTARSTSVSRWMRPVAASISTSRDCRSIRAPSSRRWRRPCASGWSPWAIGWTWW